MSQYKDSTQDPTIPKCLMDHLNTAFSNIHYSIESDSSAYELLNTIYQLFDKTYVFDGNEIVEPVEPLCFHGTSLSHFVAASMLTLSGQTLASFANTRACIENAVYAYAVYKKPGLFNLWMERTEKTRHKVAKEFAIAKWTQDLKSVDSETADFLQQLYEESISLGAHPNIDGLASSLRDHGDNLYFANISPSPDSRQQKECVHLLATAGICCIRVFFAIYRIALIKRNLIEDISSCIELSNRYGASHLGEHAD